jgi:atypical dual specificity phosphatase
MGVCFRSPKLPLKECPALSSNQGESGGSYSSTNQGNVRPLVWFSSSSQPRLTALSEGNQKCYPHPDLSNLNSDALAGLVTAMPRSSKSKLFGGRESVQFRERESVKSSNNSLLAAFRGRKSDVYYDMTYTQHINLYDHQNPTEILPSLYLGSKDDSAKVTRLKEIGITHILCVMSGKTYEVEGCKLLTVVMADNGNSQLQDIMKRSFPFIEESQQEGNKLLIHCNLGQNRSPTLVIAWLMSKKRWTFYNAHNYVKQKREMIHPNKSYVDQLRDLDMQLFGIYSAPDDYLAISFSDGVLTVADAMTATERTLYKSQQISLMSPQQLAAYRKSQQNLAIDEENTLVSENDAAHK